MKLCFDGVSAAYRGKQVLENVSFRAGAGEMTALLGRNGVGKTTLLRCLGGEKRDYSGKILLDGVDVRELDRDALARRLACLPQNLPAPHVTVAELVAFGRAPYLSLLGKLRPEDRERVDWALESVGMENFANAFTDTLSGGQRKKAFLAMTLAQDTPAVVLDEPAAHLDTASRFEILELISTLCRETGKTFLVVMHDLPEVFRYAHRAVVLHRGEVAFDGTPRDCLGSGIPESCFGITLAGTKETGYSVKPL